MTSLPIFLYYLHHRKNIKVLILRQKSIFKALIGGVDGIKSDSLRKYGEGVFTTSLPGFNLFIRELNMT